MTLYDIESQTGVPAWAIADRLGLPPSASLAERLGRLRKAHFFTMQDVRNALSDLMEER
jgi:hypothetical protein